MDILMDVRYYLTVILICIYLISDTKYLLEYLLITCLWKNVCLSLLPAWFYY